MAIKSTWGLWIVTSLIVVTVSVQEVVGVTAGVIQHILRDRLHVSIKRAAVDLLRMYRSHGEECHDRQADGNCPAWDD